MTINLIIFLLALCIFTFILLYRMVKKKKILFKHFLLWSLLDIALIISIFGIGYLRIISDFIGIEKISNMIFLFGFIVIIGACIGLTTQVAEQKNKIIILSQELGITNKKIKELEDEKNKRVNKK